MTNQYRRAVINELNEVVEWVSDLTGGELNELLEEHPEYRITCVGVA